MHKEDLSLVRDNKIPFSHLITIRRGEPTHDPIRENMIAAPAEFIKLAGKGKEWTCLYFIEESGCAVYHYRPQACRALKCWDTAGIIALMGRELLDRHSVLGANHHMLQAIEEHETIVSYDFFADFFVNQKTVSKTLKAEIENRVQLDLCFRDKIIRKKNLSLAEELFYFGRPLFQLLQPFGIGIVHTRQGLQLCW